MKRLAALMGFVALSCANGDGRGFASVDGTLRVSAPDDDFKTAAGQAATLERVTVTVASVSLVDTETSDTTVTTKTASLPVGTSFDPLAGEFTLPFGPYEVDRGEFATLAVAIRRVEAEGLVGSDKSFTITYTSTAPLVLTSGADLPVDGKRSPNIHLQITLALPRDLFEGLDPLADGAADALADRLSAADGVVKATWTRTGD